MTAAGIAYFRARARYCKHGTPENEPTPRLVLARATNKKPDKECGDGSTWLARIRHIQPVSAITYKTVAMLENETQIGQGERVSVARDGH
jgi:hypothetical protein